MSLMDGTKPVELTARELTLIRVACIQRLDKLKDNPDLKASYAETCELLNGKLWNAVRSFHLVTGEKPNGNDTQS